MSSYMLHSKVQARPGLRDATVAKFLEAAAIQRDNPDCLLTLVSTAPSEPDTVYLTEVWTDKQSHQRATKSDAIKPWAMEMQLHVERLVESTELDTVGGKGLDIT